MAKGKFTEERVIAGNLRDYMTRNGMSVKEVSKLTKIPERTLYGYLANTNNLPLIKLRKIMTVVGMEEITIRARA